MQQYVCIDFENIFDYDITIFLILAIWKTCFVAIFIVSFNITLMMNQMKKLMT